MQTLTLDPRLDPTNKQDISFSGALASFKTRQAARPVTTPAPVAGFDLDPDVVADVRADLNDAQKGTDFYYTDAQVERALFRFVQAELEALLEDVGNKFFELPAHRREKFLES